MPTENWSLFDLLIGKLAIAGSHLASVAHPLALFATAIPAPGTIEAGKLATINRSGEANMTNVRRVDECERARELAQQIPPSAVLYELAVGLRERGWKYVQIISNLPSLTHRAMGARPDFHWPCLKSVTELGGGAIYRASATGGLGDQLVDLLEQDDALELREAEIAAAREETAALEIADGPPAIVERVAAVDEVTVHPGDRAALAGGDVF